MAMSGKNLLTGMVVGAGLVAAAPLVLPFSRRYGRPIVKSLIKGSMSSYEKSMEGVAELTEIVEDAVAELRFETGKAVAEKTGGDEEVDTVSPDLSKEVTESDSEVNSMTGSHEEG